MMLIRETDMLLDISKVRCRKSTTQLQAGERDGERKAKLGNDCTLFGPAEESGIDVLVFDGYQQ